MVEPISEPMEKTYPYLGERCKRVLIYSEEEAKRLGHKSILPEHMLVGMLREDHNVGGHILRKSGLTAEIVQLSLERSLGHGTGNLEGRIPFSAKSDKILSKDPNSEEYPLELRHTATGTEHILYGILHFLEGESVNYFLSSNRVSEKKLLER